MTMINSRKFLLHVKETLYALVCVCVHVHACAGTCSLTSGSLQHHGQIVVRQAPLSMGFSWQEMGRLPFPPPGALPNPGIEPVSPANQVDFFTAGPPGKTLPISSHFLFPSALWNQYSACYLYRFTSSMSFMGSGELYHLSLIISI